MKATKKSILGFMVFKIVGPELVYFLNFFYYLCKQIKFCMEFGSQGFIMVHAVPRPHKDYSYEPYYCKKYQRLICAWYFTNNRLFVESCFPCL